MSGPRDGRPRNGWRWGLVLLHSSAIFFVSSHSDVDFGPATILQADKAVHVAVYLLWGWFFSRALAGSIPGLQKPSRIALAAAAGLLYGVFDELHQSFVPGRNCDIADIAADGIGACLGSFLPLMDRYRKGDSRSDRDPESEARR